MSDYRLLKMPCGCEIGFQIYDEEGRPADTHFLPCASNGHTLTSISDVVEDFARAVPEIRKDLEIGLRMLASFYGRSEGGPP